MLTFLKSEFIFRYFESFLKMKHRYRPGWPSPPGPPTGGAWLPLSGRGVPSRKKSWHGHCKFLNQIKEFTENFSGFIVFIKIENFQIIIRKNSEIPVKYVRFFEIFLSFPNRFFGQENVDIFENSIHFLILWIVLKNETSLPSGLAFAPRTPCGGRLIAFKWPRRSLPPKAKS